MADLTQVQLASPYLVLIGDVEEPGYAKTGFGLAHWCPDRVAGQLRFRDCPVDLGVPDLTIPEASKLGVKSLVVGVAPVGGVISQRWWEVLTDAATAGLDVVAGLHIRLNNCPELVAVASRSGVRLIDARVPPDGLPVGTGVKRSGKRMLMVGTDCAVGKKYSALSMHRAMLQAGFAATFRATGQTGIMIAGQGIPIDAVVADFVSGAAEVLSPDNKPNHWDVIEGQGSLSHPGYAGVSVGLLHGSQPDAIVVCHDANRTHIGEWPDYPLPSIQACIDLNLNVGRLTNPDIQCVGVSINTASLGEHESDAYLKRVSHEIGLPCVDPLRHGPHAIVEHLKVLFA